MLKNFILTKIALETNLSRLYFIGFDYYFKLNFLSPV